MNGLEQEFSGKINVVRVDVTDPDNRALLLRHRVPGTPYLVFTDASGQVLFRRGGARTAEAMRADVEALAAKVVR